MSFFFFNLGATLTKPGLSGMTYSSSFILRCHFLNVCCSHGPFLLFAANRLFAITLTSFHYVCLWKWDPVSHSTTWPRYPNISVWNNPTFSVLKMEEKFNFLPYKGFFSWHHDGHQMHPLSVIHPKTPKKFSLNTQLIYQTTKIKNKEWEHVYRGREWVYFELELWAECRKSAKSISL